jgi:hypothetical protein
LISEVEFLVVEEFEIEIEIGEAIGTEVLWVV